MIHTELSELFNPEHTELVCRMTKGSAMAYENFHPVMVDWRQCLHGLQQVSSHPLAGLQKGFGAL